MLSVGLSVQIIAALYASYLLHGLAGMGIEEIEKVARSGFAATPLLSALSVVALSLLTFFFNGAVYLVYARFASKTYTLPGDTHKRIIVASFGVALLLGAYLIGAAFVIPDLL